MITREKALELRKIIERAVESLDDNTALKAIILYPTWTANQSYEAGSRIQYKEVLYRVLTTHISSDGQTPDMAPSLFEEVLALDGDNILDWEQPDSTSAYKQGDRVRYNNKIWESVVDNNVWEPGVYGWEEVTE